MTTFNLVIQGREVSTPALKSLYKMTGAEAIEQVGVEVFGHAFRLRNANPASQPQVAAFCAEERLDHAFMPSGARLHDFRLLAMDMDSTLISIECIDEVAAFAQKKSEVAAITASAMRGEIDWPESLRRRVALLKGVDAGALKTIYDQRICLSEGAERLIAMARRKSVRTLLLSGGFTYFTERLKERVGFDYAYGNTLDIVDGKIAGTVSGPLIDADAKAAHVAAHAKELGLARDQVLAIGDGANDLKMMAEAGFSIAYHARPIVRERATCSLSYTGLDGVLALFAG